MSWEAVIGLEVHAQLLTDSKLFCGCSTAFGAEPNAHTCPVCMGFPGVLPVLNRRAVELAVRAGLACGSEIAREAEWARKNYFYPDLPKGYQISMYDSPLCIGGEVEYVLDGSDRRARLTRIHMEEDAGKSIHDADASASLVDLNRAGTPLLEIVSEPDLRSPAEAGAYLRALRSTLQYLEVCDGNMEEGSLRCDANVSVRRAGEPYGTRVEIKNLNSFRAVEKALEHEIRRQTALVGDGGKVVQETRLWDPDREHTRPMRSKEEAHDYRYFPEPDLPPLRVERALVESIRGSLPETPRDRRRRFEGELSLSAADAEVLTARRDVAEYYEAALAARPSSAKALANWVMDAVLRVVRERKLDAALRIVEWPVTPAALADLVALIEDGTISGKIAKTVFEDMAATGKPARAIVEERGLVQVTDTGAIGAAIDQVLAANAEKVAEYRAGKDKLFGYFVGQIMKATGGKANPKALNELLKQKLAG